MDITDTLTKEQPRLNLIGGEGEPQDFHSNPKLLRKLESLLSPGHTTLETGTGWSTVVFAKAGTKHTCVAPHPKEVELVRSYCSQHNIRLENINFVIERSEDALPRLQTEDSLDLVFVDGGHAFPLPIIDWFYSSRQLKVGGIMIVDDIDIRSCNILYQMMAADSAWQMHSRGDNYAIFKKIAPMDISWWRKQRYSRHKIGIGGTLESFKFYIGRKLKN